MYKLLFYELINKFIFLGGFSYEKDKETVSMFDRSSHHVYHGKYGVCGRECIVKGIDRITNFETTDI